MKRAVIALVLALAALTLLISLALESQSLPVETHVAQYTIAGDLERLNGDFRALVETLESAWREQTPPGEGARALLSRVAAQPQQLPESLFTMRGSASQEARLSNSHTTFIAAISQATELAGEFIAEQTEYAAAVLFLRESGAGVIQEIRSQGLDRQAADTFQLVVGSVDFAGKDASVRASELERLLVTLTRDQRVDAMPGDVEVLLKSVETILKNKPLIESRLEQLVGTPVSDHAAALSSAAQDLYTVAVTRIDQARLMLAVYAVVLLLAVGFIALRLHSSYREINSANADLASLNESLEQRVASRTQELSGTLSDLKESQVQLVQAEKMSSLGQLVAGISHEINTPLLYLANNAELIRERLEPMRDFISACVAAFSIKSEDFPDRAEYQTKFVGALRDVKILLRDHELDAAIEERWRAGNPSSGRWHAGERTAPRTMSLRLMVRLPAAGWWTRGKPPSPRHRQRLPHSSPRRSARACLRGRLRPAPGAGSRAGRAGHRAPQWPGNPAHPALRPRLPRHCRFHGLQCPRRWFRKGRAARPCRSGIGRSAAGAPEAGRTQRRPAPGQLRWPGAVHTRSGAARRQRPPPCRSNSWLRPRSRHPDPPARDPDGPTAARASGRRAGGTSPAEPAHQAWPSWADRSQDPG